MFLQCHIYIFHVSKFYTSQSQKYLTYAILLHSLILTFIFHYIFVHLYGFYRKILYDKTAQLKFLSQI